MRRHLGYAPVEVDAMSWWEERMWVEKLLEEFGEGEGEDAPTVAPNEESSLSDLGGLGMDVRRVS